MADDDADDLLLQVEEVVVDGNEFIEFESGGQELDHAYQSREWIDGSWVKWVTKIGWVTWVMGH